MTIIEVTAPELGTGGEDRRHSERSAERRNEEAIARVSPPREPETLTRKREADRMANERIQERVSIERHDRIQERPDRTPIDRILDRTERIPERRSSDRLPPDRISNDRISSDRLSDRSSLNNSERKSTDRLSTDKMLIDRIHGDRISVDKMSHDRLSGDKLSHDRLSGDKLSHDRLSNDKMSHDKLSIDRLSGDKLPLDRVERVAPDRYIRAEADVGFVQNSLPNGEHINIMKKYINFILMKRFIVIAADAAFCMPFKDYILLCYGKLFYCILLLGVVNLI